MDYPHPSVIPSVGIDSIRRVHTPNLSVIPTVVEGSSEQGERSPSSLSRKGNGNGLINVKDTSG
ncbi:MAG: hypothetical protein K2M95_04520 [Clostridiales bacterium]|nr:hypothetical protein [Clostridiales bacterium]